MDEKKVELAKSWFVFAQITIILAGFLFAGSSISLSKAQENLDSSLTVDSRAMENINFRILNWEILNENNLTTHYSKVYDVLLNSSENLRKLSVANIDLGRSQLIFALTFTLLSFIFFLFGRFKLSKLSQY